MEYKILLVCFLCTFTCGKVNSNNFNLRESGAITYNYCTNGDEGPDTWASDVPDHCSGSQQSPINIPTSPLYVKSSKLVWNGYGVKPSSITLKNDGKTVQLFATWPQQFVPTISGGFLNNTYKFLQIHYHWGTANQWGSEHAINGKLYPIEMHAIHIRQDLNLSEALVKPDGLVVLGFMGEIANNPSRPGIGDPLLTPYLKNLKQKNSNMTIPPVPLSNLFPTYQSDYTTYKGSLTTPTCNEVVTWMLQMYPISVTSRFLTSFRDISNANVCMSNNFRPIQPRNGRTVKYIFGTN